MSTFALFITTHCALWHGIAVVVRARINLLLNERNERSKKRRMFSAHERKKARKMLDHVHGTDIAEICTCFPYLCDTVATMSTMPFEDDARGHITHSHTLTRTQRSFRCSNSKRTACDTISFALQCSIRTPLRRGE